MTVASTSDDEFVEIVEKYGATGASKKLGVNLRNIYARRARLENKLGRQITIESPIATRHSVEHPQRALLDVQGGIVLVGSDGHYWPGPASTAHRAFVKFCKELKPRAVVMNGDALDGARISRHAPIGWEKRPALIDEIEACKERLGEIEAAAFKAEKVWCLGNHDARFETRIATVAPEYAKVQGVHLRDHFPLWRPAWSCWVNNSVVIKHRYKGGVHAPHNNTVMAGKSIVTGHLHSAKVTPFTDYNGTRYGVDTGCLADPDHAAFTDYTEDGPKNWLSGFAVLTFHKGQLLPPELVTVWDAEHVAFRGALIKV